MQITFYLSELRISKTLLLFTVREGLRKKKFMKAQPQLLSTDYTLQQQELLLSHGRVLIYIYKVFQNIPEAYTQVF